MSFDIQLSNPFSRWEMQYLNGVHFFFKGNLFYNDELLTLEKIIYLFDLIDLNSGEYKLQEFNKLLENMCGEYALIIESQYEIVCVVDRLRSIPLFYSLDNGYFIISDDAYYIKDKIKPHLKEENAAEFLVTGYVTGSETLFENIRQIQAGEVLIYNKKVNSLQTFFYFEFIHRNFIDLSEGELLSKLDICFLDVFKRLLDSTINKGKQIVVPLSGGLDSRIIVAMLKRLGIEDVICFSYGNMKTREAKISKQVAEALGYKWYFVEYTNEKWYNAYYSKDMQLYQKYAGNLVSLPHIQDYLAVKVLKAEGKLPENSVIIPGHTGDMISGGHIPLGYADSSHNYTKEILLKSTLKNHYNLWKWEKNTELKQFFEAKVLKSIENFEITDNESCANAIEFFDFNERQVKFIVNSVRNYEFFGYEWRIPLWDLHLINFFLSIPLNLRVYQYLYFKYVSEILFKGELDFLCSIDCTTRFNTSKINEAIFYKSVKFISSLMLNKISSELYIPMSFLDIQKTAIIIEDHPLLKYIYIHNKKLKLLPYGNNICTLNIISLICYSKEYDA